MKWRVGDFSRNWVRQADRDLGRRQDGLTTAEREEVRRLHFARYPPGKCEARVG